MFDAGRLRERIKIRRRVETKNSGGGLDLSWTTLADNLSAEIVSLDGREALVGNVLQGISSWQVTVRFRDDVKPGDQLIWLTAGNRELNIRSAGDRADRTQKRQWLTLHVTNEAPQGA